MAHNVKKNKLEKCDDVIYIKEDNIVIDKQILNEVPIFKKILQDNIYNSEVFHGYINKINDTWNVILNPRFKSLLLMYNNKYYCIPVFFIIVLVVINIGCIY